MKKIALLDCTLRDGGYVNDWNFGKDAIREIGYKIIQSGVEYFEIGFLKDIEYDEEKSLFSCVEDIGKVIYPKSPESIYVAMIDMKDPLPIEKLSSYDGNSIDAIRVIFKKDKIADGLRYCERVKEKGYEVFVQPVGSDRYSDEEFIELIQKSNEISPDAFYIVDTFGLIKRKQFVHFLNLADTYLNKNIILGYHSHNNLQQAFGNAEAMTDYETERHIILDACIFGMGRGAGNLNMELFAEYLNENYQKHYRIEPMLEVIDTYLNDIYCKNFWGYSLPFYLSATNKCHPNYASYYARKGTLTVKSFNELLKSVSEKDKDGFSIEKAEYYYRSYQECYVDDSREMKLLKHNLMDKNILVLAPGYSIKAQQDEIRALVEKEKPIIISVNFISDLYKSDYVFSSNMRRYRGIMDEQNVLKIITSNINEDVAYDFKLNYSSYCCSETEIIDNSGVMLLNVLIALGIRKIYLAGFDGYDIHNRKNYVNSGLEYSWSEQEMKKRNKLVANEFLQKKHLVDLIFVTKSCYTEWMKGE